MYIYNYGNAFSCLATTVNYFVSNYLCIFFLSPSTLGSVSATYSLFGALLFARYGTCVLGELLCTFFDVFLC